jgi:hypothetical protein
MRAPAAGQVHDSVDKTKGPAKPALIDKFLPHPLPLIPIPSPARGEGGEPKRERRAFYKRGTINSATMLMILIMGLIAGPAVSL